MTVEEASVAMAAIETLYDGSRLSAYKVERLKQILIESPEHFWDSYFNAVQKNDPLRQLAQGLLMSGAVTSATTFAALPAILAERQ